MTGKQRAGRFFIFHMKKIKVAISPCPNDTFIFDALINKRISWEGLEFDFEYHDIRELNSIAKKHLADVIKVSFYTYYQIKNDYQLLTCGSAFGKGCGPLLISNSIINVDKITGTNIAIPGIDTTAHFLLQFFNDSIPLKNKIIVPFHEIIPKLVAGEINSGVIIHESRFTYSKYNLHLIQDLGDYWEKKTNSYIPLGGIVASKQLENDMILQIDDLIRKSVIFAFENPEISRQFIKSHAQELDDNVIRSHIELYVNEFSIDLGIEGNKTIAFFLDQCKKFEVEK